MNLSREDAATVDARGACNAPLLSLCTGPRYTARSRHDWCSVWFRTAPALLLMLPPGYLTPLYRHLLPETDHLRHRGRGVRPTTPSRCVTAVDTCVGRNVLHRLLMTSRGAFTSGQPVVTLQRLSQAGIPGNTRPETAIRDLSLSTGRPPTTCSSEVLRYRGVVAARVVSLVSSLSGPPRNVLTRIDRPCVTTRW